MDEDITCILSLDVELTGSLIQNDKYAHTLGVVPETLDDLKS